MRYGPTASTMRAIVGSVERRCWRALRILTEVFGSETRLGPACICHCMKRLAVSAAVLAGVVIAAWSQETEPLIKIDVDLVSILFSARDKRGALVPDLTKDDFVVLEDGKQQTIRTFTKETDLPLTIGL